MKKFIKILLPTSAIASMGLATGCSCTVSHDPAPISRDYLKIENGILKGFKDEYKDKQLPESQYALVVPQDVTGIDNMAFSEETDAQNNHKIVSISFEANSQCTSMGGASFMGCINLKTVVLPPSLTTFGETIFQGCNQLTTIDLTKISQAVTMEGWYAPSRPGWFQTGKIVYLESNTIQATFANQLLGIINDTEGNNWQLDPE